MGVTGLWTVVQPCARPIKLETLNRKRLAVDASIWIYQFLKAVRDKEGNALRNSHVVGFFRRICKLLYFGIKPVFVFDGGAPALKRATVAGRKRRREGRREDAVRTAGKLLGVKMKRRAEVEEERAREEMGRVRQEVEEEVRDEELVYVEEIGMSVEERNKSRKFKRKDQYHLPELEGSIAEMGAPNDPRVMSQEELEEYARQFHSGEDINLYDFSKIDFNSAFFLSLPAGDRYNILNAARLRSRLRMGYSKEQLDGMFPDRMAFSRFQIERVTERNELTQRLMNINGMNGVDGLNVGGRIAGEKGREYVLVKNDGVEGGWALGVVTNKEQGKETQPIDVDEYGKEVLSEEGDEEEWEDDGGFEDVPIEGLNRLPKSLKRTVHNLDYDYDESYRAQEIAEKRRAVYEARRNAAKPSYKPTQKEPEMEEVEAEEEEDDDDDALFVPDTNGNGKRRADEDGLFEERDAESENEREELRRAIEMSLEKPEEEAGGFQPEEIPPPSLKFNKASAEAGRGFAHQMNTKASRPTMFDVDDEEELDLQGALAESRSSKYQPKSLQEHTRPRRVTSPSPKARPAPTPQKDHPFDGPLPFESLNFGKSILGKKKKPAEDSQEGGFEREPAQKGKEHARPLPPWFAGAARDIGAKPVESSQQEEGLGDGDDESFRNRTLNRMETGEVINVDSQAKEVINVESEDDEKMKDKWPIVIDDELRMDDVAHLIRAEPPVPQEKMSEPNGAKEKPNTDEEHDSSEEEFVEWEESDLEDPPAKDGSSRPTEGRLQVSPSKSASLEFENVATLGATPIPSPRPASESPLVDDFDDAMFNERFDPLEMQMPDEENEFSDPEDEELMAALAIEAEEHARFASTLNQKSATENAFDYERELKQLRNQQKKDRRDADEVSHIMITECQALLRHFGLPYITAPMEAEAQCAELVSLGLVDGIVTDDSDIFLFGGNRVYKNMFNQGKFVECYLTTDLEKEYALDRQKLIRFAHLLGSDYTDGIPGIGPVSALEILAEFPTLEGFAHWWSQLQLDPKSSALLNTPFRKKFGRNSTKMFLPPVFPDTRVDEAYLKPEVDSDSSPFQWGVPDLDSLRAFLMATIGWTQERTDEVLVPVIRDMNRRENEGTQSNITSYMGGGVGAGAFAPRVRTEGMGRMEKAFRRLRREAERQRGVGGKDAPMAQDVARNVIEEAPDKIGKKRKSGPTPAKKGGRGKKGQEIDDDDAAAAADDDDVGMNNETDEIVEDGDDAYETPKRKKTTRKGKKTA